MKTLMAVLLLVSAVTVAQAPGDLNPGENVLTSPPSFDHIPTGIDLIQGNPGPFEKPAYRIDVIISGGGGDILEINGISDAPCAKRRSPTIVCIDNSPALRRPEHASDIDAVLIDSHGQHWHAVWEKVKP